MPTNSFRAARQPNQWRILLIDDDEDDFIIIRDLLASAGEDQFSLEWAASFETGRDAMAAGAFDAVLVNYDLSPRLGVDLIREAVSKQYQAPVLLLSGRGDPERDIEGLHAGAADYIHKDDLTAQFLQRSIRYAIERRRMENELARSRQERLDILASIQDGFFALDRDWRIIYINQRAAQNGGFTPEELLGKNIFDTFPRVRGTALEANYRRAMTERVPIQFEMQGVYQDIWYSISVYPAGEGLSIFWQDVTARKQVEEALRLSEERFNKAFFATPHPMVISRLEDGLIVDINESFERLFGYPRAEVLGKTSLELHLFANPADREAAVRRLRAEHSVRDFEVAIRTQSGEIRQALLSAETIATGSEILLLTVLQDITERRKAEAALREALDRSIWLARFPDENPNPVMRVAADGCVLYANPTAKNLPGWQGDLTHPISAPLLPLVQVAMTSGKEKELEEDVQIGDRFYSVTVMPFVEEKYANLYGRDVTQRKQAEHAQREAEARFRIALSNTSIAVFSTDLDLRYTWFYSTAMGALPEAFIGRRDDEILPPTNAAEFMALKRRAITQKTSVNEEIQLILAAQPVTMIVSIEPYYDSQGALIGVIGACFDITEQRRLEAINIEHHTQMEVQRRLMDYREKERQEIARDLHDGPVQDLSSLVFHIQYLAEAIADPAAQLELIQIRSGIKRVIQDLRTMMNELRPPTLIRFGLGKAIQYHLEDLKERYPQVAFTFRYSQSEKTLPENESLALFRVYQEALTNITRHAEASKVMVHLRRKKGQVLMEIRDDGRGFILPADLSILTEANHFGLAGMKERAESIGGSLHITSEPGRGTLVRMALPLGEAKPPPLTE